MLDVNQNIKHDKVSDNIYLIGFMGCGKTTVGESLAALLERRFLDTDACIEKKVGTTISEIFEPEGESVFRRHEAEVLREVANLNNVVVATGGGIVLAAANRELLRSGTTVYLRATIALLKARLENDRTRPLLNNADSQNKLAELLAARSQIYFDTADLIIDVEDATDIQIAQKIHQNLHADENRKS